MCPQRHRSVSYRAAAGGSEVMDVRVKLWSKLSSAHFSLSGRTSTDMLTVRLYRRKKKCSHLKKNSSTNIIRKVRYRQTLPLESHSFSLHQQRKWNSSDASFYVWVTIFYYLTYIYIYIYLLLLSDVSYLTDVKLRRAQLLLCGACLLFMLWC